MTAKVGIVMGSKSDWSTMIETTKILDELNIPYENKLYRHTEHLIYYLNMHKMQKQEV